MFKFPTVITFLFFFKVTNCEIIVAMTALKDCLGPNVLNGLATITGRPGSFIH